MIKDNKKYTIYILELERGKYYVGRSEHTKNRLNDHFLGRGSVFTRKYKPKKLLQTFSNCDEFDEDKYVFKLMDVYGIENVRGGVFSSLTISDNDRSYIEKRILGASDRCYYCRSPDHFIRECPERTYNHKQSPPEKQWVPLSTTIDSTVSTVSSLSYDDDDDYDDYGELYSADAMTTTTTTSSTAATATTTTTTTTTSDLSTYPSKYHLFVQWITEKVQQIFFFGINQ